MQAARGCADASLLGDRQERFQLMIFHRDDPVSC
jgi:hypothetical protein